MGLTRHKPCFRIFTLIRQDVIFFTMNCNNSIISAILSQGSVSEILAANDIRTHVVIMDASIHAFVYKSRKGKYHIIGNAYLSPAALKKVFFHELKHIIVDMPSMGYWVGIDQQRHEIEQEADVFYKVVGISNIN